MKIEGLYRVAGGGVNFRSPPSQSVIKEAETRTNFSASADADGEYQYQG